MYFLYIFLQYIYRLLLIVNRKTKDNKKSNSKRATTKLVDLTFHELKVNWSPDWPQIPHGVLTILPLLSTWSLMYYPWYYVHVHRLLMTMHMMCMSSLVPRPFQDFISQPRLGDKIWEWPGDEACAWACCVAQWHCTLQAGGVRDWEQDNTLL